MVGKKSSRSATTTPTAASADKRPSGKSESARAQTARSEAPDDLQNDDPATNGDRYIVPALRRGLALLRLFTSERRVIGVPEMVRELGISRATAFRLAYTLEADGYLQRAPHSTAFQLGLNVLSLGFEYLGSLSAVEIGRPILEDLRDRIDASVHMGVRHGTDAVYVLSLPSKHRLRSSINVGSHMPAHATSIGRTLLFDMSLGELRKLYRGVEMTSFSSQTPTTVDALYKQLEKERQKGYVSYKSAFAPGIASVAAPVRDQSGHIVAGINVSDYESLGVMQDRDGRLKDEVLRAAAAISRDLGFRGVPAPRS